MSQSLTTTRVVELYPRCQRPSAAAIAATDALIAGLVRPTTTTRVVEALSTCGFLTTAGLARSLKVGRDAVVAAFDEIEAAGIKLMRVRGIGGGAEIIEVRS